MTILSVYLDTAPEQPLKVLTHLEDIAPTLAEAGVHIERWDASAPISAGASSEEVMEAYRPQIDRLKQERGLITLDVISLGRKHPHIAEMRDKILSEHRHAADEVRFFVAGRGLFTFHVDDKVYAVQCEKSDLITVPAGTRRWFDIGEDPHLVAICLCSNPGGCDVESTDDDIAGRFPRLDD
jgi:1,2-dihydroxy-3-keto-5-methylthiopentene dioxygenase